MMKPPLYIIAIAVLAGTLFLVRPNVVLAASQIYTTPGTYSFTVPAGVTSMQYTVIGGGGGGGGYD